MSVLWKLNRLRAMGVREIAFRVGRVLTEHLESRGLGLASPATAQGTVGRPWCAPICAGVDASLYIGAADRILSGHFDVFALKDAALGFPPSWNRDPKTGIVAPLSFGKRIDYRNDQVVGDIKYLWEPSRHLELVTLAQAWHVTRDPRYALGCRTLLRSWFEQCPYPQGVHWTSSLELAIRLVNWYFAWHFLNGSPVFEGDDGAAFRNHWLRCVFEHCHFISGYLSLHSSANNHLLGEYLGLFVGAVAWPMWPQSAAWRDKARAGFIREFLLQNAPDGVNREQAIYYQHEVIDMGLLASLIGRANGVAIDSAVAARLESMVSFTAAMVDRSGNVPAFGDADDAVIVRFVPNPDFNVYRSILNTAAILFGNPSWAVKARDCDDKTRWLLGDTAEQALSDLRRQRPEPHRQLIGPRAFREGGYYLMGSGFGEVDEIRLVADAGPLGYLSIAAHGHSDALAFTLSVGGQPVLIDPGTFAYHSQPEWREYFRGTAAHNTVRVDEQDQSVSGGSFLWLRHARAHCLAFEGEGALQRFVGVHDGYHRLPDPVTHRREIEFDAYRRLINVHDELICERAHWVEVHWHFAEDCRVELDGADLLIRKKGCHLKMSLSGVDFNAECVAGQQSPPLGWVSRRYDLKEPSPTVRWFAHLLGRSRWTTQFAIHVSV